MPPSTEQGIPRRHWDMIPPSNGKMDTAEISRHDVPPSQPKTGYSGGIGTRSPLSSRKRDTVETSRHDVSPPQRKTGQNGGVGTRCPIKGKMNTPETSGHDLLPEREKGYCGDIETRCLPTPKKKGIPRRYWDMMFSAQQKKKYTM